MAPRPKDPPPDRRQEILAAALRVFSRKGFAAATNAEIAREAGVTPAALYYYYPSKAELFRAALSDRAQSIRPLLSQLESMRDQPPERVLPELLREVVGFFTTERTRDLVRIMLAEGPRNPELNQIWQEQIVDRVIPGLMGYLLHQLQKGTLRPVDPRVLHLIFIGPVLTAVLTRDLLQVPLLQDLTNAELARSLADGVLHGLLNRPDRHEGSEPR